MMLEYIKLSIRELFHNKLRTFLSLIGIVIGVAVVYVILSIKDISSIAITKEIAGDGGIININYVTDKKDEMTILNSSFASSFGESDGGSSAYRFSPEDAQEIKKMDIVADALAQYSTYDRISFNRKSVNISVRRNSENFVSFYDLKLVQGKYIEDYPEDTRGNLCIISDKIVTESMNLKVEEAVGTTIRINNRLITIVGVCTSENSAIKRMVLLSKEAYDSMYPSGTIQNLAVKLNSTEDLKDSSKIVVHRLNEIHGTLDTKDGYAEEDLSSIISQITSVTNILSIVMTIIASISILVAGIGVMNIMLVSVIERTREIGVKRALGAPKSAIQFQFIVESCLLTLIGGLIGVALGLIIIHVALIMLKMEMPVNIFYVNCALLFSITLGIIFGYFPARRAANLNIIDAIQSE